MSKRKKLKHEIGEDKCVQETEDNDSLVHDCTECWFETYCQIKVKPRN